MKSMPRLAIAIALGSLLAACADLQPTDAMLTYESVPEGATIFEGGHALGVAPVTRTYPSNGKSAVIQTPEVTAVWPSGAKESFWTELPLGADRVAKIERPHGAPGLQVDLDQAKKVAAQREQAAARDKDAVRRDMARDSARCQAQLRNGPGPTDDCH